jgi:hypothetical protein
MRLAVTLYALYLIVICLHYEIVPSAVPSGRIILQLTSMQLFRLYQSSRALLKRTVSLVTMHW